MEISAKKLSENWLDKFILEHIYTEGLSYVRIPKKKKTTKFVTN